jgi:hypothetical protein
MDDQPEALNTLVGAHLLAGEQALTEQFRQAPPRPALSSDRVGTCSGKSGMEFKGDYRSIELRDCEDVLIRNARIGRLSVIRSRATLLDTDILGKEEGLLADNSDITVTNGNISGEIAIRAKNSRLDLAGVHLDGSRDAVKAMGSKLLFSVSWVHSPHTDGALHTYKKMNDEVL